MICFAIIGKEKQWCINFIIAYRWNNAYVIADKRCCWRGCVCSRNSGLFCCARGSQCTFKLWHGYSNSGFLLCDRRWRRSRFQNGWRYRVDRLDEYIQKVAETMSKSERESTYLNVNLTYKGEWKCQMNCLKILKKKMM